MRGPTIQTYRVRMNISFVIGLNYDDEKLENLIKMFKIDRSIRFDFGPLNASLQTHQPIDRL